MGLYMVLERINYSNTSKFLSKNQFFYTISTINLKIISHVGVGRSIQATLHLPFTLCMTIEEYLQKTQPNYRGGCGLQSWMKNSNEILY